MNSPATEARSIIRQHLSAYFALANLAKLKSGQTVLVTGSRALHRRIDGADGEGTGAHVVAATRNAEPPTR